MTVVGTPSSPRTLRAGSLAGRPAAAVLAWCALIAVAAAWGGILLWRGAFLSSIGAPPLWGHFGWIMSPGIIVALAASAAVILLVPRLSRTLRWRGLLIAVPLIGFVWVCSLTFVVGSNEIIRPVLSSNEYLRELPRVGDPITFLSQFVESIGTYSTHVRAHPPGMLLVLWGLEHAGLAGPWPAALLMIGVGCSAAAATLVAIREVSSERAARVAAPFLAIAPAAIWIATSADAFFAGVSAWAVASIVVATGRLDRRGDPYAVVGGLLFGFALMLSYGMAALVAVPIVVAVARRRVRPLILAGLGAVAVLAAFLAMGFSWWSGFFATRHEYLIFHTRFRPYGYFLVANLAAFAVALGPAVGRALGTLKDRGVWLLVGGALIAVAAANLSGLSKGEVERIWLPFAPWMLAGTVNIDRERDRWLAGQIGVALLLAVFLRTAW